MENKTTHILSINKQIHTRYTISEKTILECVNKGNKIIGVWLVIDMMMQMKQEIETLTATRDDCQNTMKQQAEQLNKVLKENEQISRLNEQNQSLKDEIEKQKKLIQSQAQKHYGLMSKMKETFRLKEEELNEKESTYRVIQEANDALCVQSKEYEAKCDEYVAKIQAMEEQNTNEHNENTQHIKRYEQRMEERDTRQNR
eukprot:909606_1